MASDERTNTISPDAWRLTLLQAELAVGAFVATAVLLLLHDDPFFTGSRRFGLFASSQRSPLRSFGIEMGTAYDPGVSGL
jgi:hypothetical protein